MRKLQNITRAETKVLNIFIDLVNNVAKFKICNSIAKHS
jgi:hypothetical protein